MLYITFVVYANISPACVSTIGNAVTDPPGGFQSMGVPLWLWKLHRGAPFRCGACIRIEWHRRRSPRVFDTILVTRRKETVLKLLSQNMPKYCSETQIICISSDRRGPKPLRHAGVAAVLGQIAVASGSWGGSSRMLIQWPHWIRGKIIEVNGPWPWMAMNSIALLNVELLEGTRKSIPAEPDTPDTIPFTGRTAQVCRIESQYRGLTCLESMYSQDCTGL